MIRRLLFFTQMRVRANIGRAVSVQAKRVELGLDRE